MKFRLTFDFVRIFVKKSFHHGDPLENMAAVLDAVEKYRHYKG